MKKMFKVWSQESQMTKDELKQLGATLDWRYDLALKEKVALVYLVSHNSPVGMPLGMVEVGDDKNAFSQLVVIFEFMNLIGRNADSERLIRMSSAPERNALDALEFMKDRLDE